MIRYRVKFVIVIQLLLIKSRSFTFIMMYCTYKEGLLPNSQKCKCFIIRERNMVSVALDHRTSERITFEAHRLPVL